MVENLRGGPDAWDATLILKAGEIARDLGFALRIEPVVIALASGSPLDDLDEALRSAEAGGIGVILRQAQASQDSGTTVVAGVAHDHREDLRGGRVARLSEDDMVGTTKGDAGNRASTHLANTSGQKHWRDVARPGTIGP